MATVSNDEHWLIYTNGLHGKLGSGIDCLIVTPFGERVEKAIRLGFKASNNEAECEAIISGLQTTKEMGAKHVQLFIN